MKQEILDRLQGLSEKREPLAANTVRYPKTVDDEMRKLCAQNKNIKLATLLRECVVAGWRILNSETNSEGTRRELAEGVRGVHSGE